MNKKSDRTLIPNTAISSSQESDNAAVVTSNSHSSHISTQLKLLSLAKKFKLDGELIPENILRPLSERANEREDHNHLLKQRNIEAIIKKAMHYSSADEVTDRVDQDWFCYFIKFAENISNKTMQELWAKILINEIAQAGSFSRKSLQTFHLMSVQEAKLLAKACSLAVKDRSKSHYRIISGAYHQPGIFNFFNKNRTQKINLNTFGLSYSDLLVLADNHLIFIQETESNILQKSEEVTFNYNEKLMTFSPKSNNCILSFYKFTPIGTELARLIVDKANTDYLQEINNTVGSLFNINIQ